MRSLALLALLLLTGCDAWPTVVQNDAEASITFQYLHRDYDHWSAKFPIGAGFAMPLSRGHWMQDIAGIKIADGRKRYEWSEQAVRRLSKACPSSKAGRNLGYAENCYLTYQGGGRVVATNHTPADLNIAGVNKGS